MDAELLKILLTVGAALGVHLGVRWYLRSELEPKRDDWRA